MIDNLRNSVFCFLFDAIFSGIEIKYNDNTFIYWEDGKLYQRVCSSRSGDCVDSISVLNINSFIKKFNSLSKKELKDIYTSLKVKKYQDSLIKKGI